MTALPPSVENEIELMLFNGYVEIDEEQLRALIILAMQAQAEEDARICEVERAKYSVQGFEAKAVRGALNYAIDAIRANAAAIQTTPEQEQQK